MNRSSIVAALVLSCACAAAAAQGSDREPALGSRRDATPTHAPTLQRQAPDKQADRKGTTDKAQPARDWLAPDKHSEKELRERFDADKDGRLSKAERRRSDSFVANHNHKHRAKMLRRFDADGDGKLSKAERAHARGKLRDNAHHRHAQRMQAFDSNDDGKLTGHEMARARAADPARVHEIEHFAKRAHHGNGQAGLSAPGRGNGQASTRPAGQKHGKPKQGTASRHLSERPSRDARGSNLRKSNRKRGGKPGG